VKYRQGSASRWHRCSNTALSVIAFTFIAFTFVALAINASAVTASAMNASASDGIRWIGLDEVIDRAQSNSFAVLEAAIELERRQADRRGARAQLLPQARLEVGANDLNGANVGSFGDTSGDLSFTRYSPSIGVSIQTNPAAALSRLRAARGNDEAAQAASQDAGRIAILEATIAYQRLLLQSALENIAQDTADDASRFVTLSTARAEAGVASGADVARAEVEVARALASLPTVRAARRGAGIELAVLLDLAPDEELRIADDEVGAAARTAPQQPQQLQINTDTTADDVGGIIEQRPDLRAARLRAEAGGQALKAAWWDLIAPDLNLGVRERLIGTDVDDLEDTTEVWGALAFTFDFGELAQLDAARAEQKSANLATRRLRRQAEAEINMARAQAAAAREAYPAFQRANQAADRALAAQRARFNAGSGSGLEVIEILDVRTRTRQDAIAAIVRYNMAQLRLAAALAQPTPHQTQ
jgi:outer membrane protein TolC